MCDSLDKWSMHWLQNWDPHIWGAAQQKRSWGSQWTSSVLVNRVLLQQKKANRVLHFICSCGKHKGYLSMAFRCFSQNLVMPKLSFPLELKHGRGTEMGANVLLNWCYHQKQMHRKGYNNRENKISPSFE